MSKPPILHTIVSPIVSDCTLQNENARGKAEFLLDILSDYGKIPLGIREQILQETDVKLLTRWFRLARQVRTLEEFINRM